ncbi:MAG: hypothetical protein AAGJ46_00275 [Planctomycetota bacterium]
MAQVRFVALVALLQTVVVVTGAHGQTALTIDAVTRRLADGVGELDRAMFFNYHGTLQAPANSNLGNLRQEAWSETGLNATTGRAATELDQFISAALPEDPTRPGFIDPAAARAKINGDYKAFVETGARWEGLREQSNPTFVQSGRNGGFLPDYLDSGTPFPTNFEAYAEFVNIYLEEAVYGPNAFLPIDRDRFYFEVMNEPNWSGASNWPNIIEMHRVTTERLKEAHPEVRVGGVSCCDDVEPGANSFDLAKQVIDEMSTWQTSTGEPAELDFYTIHPYERYDVRPDGSHFRKIHHSPGHLDAIMDLYEAYSFNAVGDPKQFAITEYGSWNRTDMADGSYGDYARDLQQWDLTRDVKEKMFVFFNRPDRLINATPFVSPRHWQNGVPTNAAGDNVFWEQDASGQWQETIVAGLYRMFAPVAGSYVAVDGGSTDLQAVAFRDGGELHVLLNNLLTTPQAVDLQGIADAFNVSSASWSRIYRQGGVNTYDADVDVSGSWSALSLEGEGAAVLTLQIDGSQVYDHAHDTRTYYADQTQVEFSTGDFLTLGVDVDNRDAVSANLRVGYTAPGGWLPAFTIRVNNNSITVPGYSFDSAYDDGDPDLFSRTLAVPVEYLRDGANDIAFFFPVGGANGEIVSAVLDVTHSVGDFNATGRLDARDVDTLYSRFGPASVGDPSDLNADGQVDAGDVMRWLSLRNTTAGDADADGDIDTRDAVAVLANVGAQGVRPEWTRGNFDADGDVDAGEVSAVLAGFTGDSPGDAEPVTIDPQSDNPRLVYDPATGAVQLAPAGNQVLAFSLSSSAGSLAGADLSPLDAAVGSVQGLADNAADQVGWVSQAAADGQGVAGFALYELGAILPAGLDLAAIGAHLDDAVWAGSGVGGQLEIVLVPVLTGDFNGDGLVDAADFTVFRDTLGSSDDLRADANRNGIVDLADYALWASNFGAQAAASQGVPEPAYGAVLATLPLVLRQRPAGLR